MDSRQADDVSGKSRAADPNGSDGLGSEFVGHVRTAGPEAKPNPAPGGHDTDPREAVRTRAGTAEQYYLFARSDSLGAGEHVFFRTQGRTIADRLCRLLTKSFSQAASEPPVAFTAQPESSIDPDDCVILNARIDHLEMLASEPDLGAFEFEVCRADRSLREYYYNASLWEDQLRGKSAEAAGARSPLQCACDQVSQTLDRHRLMFLFWARANRQNPLSGSSRTGTHETILINERPGWNDMIRAVDDEGALLSKYRWVLDRYAGEAYERFGPGDGLLPEITLADGPSKPVEGGTKPYWTIEEGGGEFLERSSDGLLQACERLAAADADGVLHPLVRRIAADARPGGRARWYECIVVKWAYLGTLDALIDDLKRARVELAMARQPRAGAVERQDGPTMPADPITTIPSPPLGESRMSPEDNRVSGLILLMLLAQAYYRLLECSISMASWCAAVDVELNHSYLWVTTSLANLLKNHKDLQDFPMKFEPLFPDLYPSTIGDVDWADIVAPEAERFLSSVQSYVFDKGIYDPEVGSPAWTFVELFRPSVNTAIERAEAYHRRIHDYRHRVVFGAGAAARSADEGGKGGATGNLNDRRDAPTGGDVQPGAAATAPAAEDATRPGETAKPPRKADNDPGQAAQSPGDRYDWARQIELVRATNQVHGEGSLNKGVLSRACSDGHLTTNGAKGRAALVQVRSFLAWVTRRFEIGKDEEVQVRNAIIGEINSRNS